MGGAVAVDLLALTVAAAARTPTNLVGIIVFSQCGVCSFPRSSASDAVLGIYAVRRRGPGMVI